MLANIAKLFYFSYSSPEIPANAFYAAIIPPGQGSAGKLPTDPRRRNAEKAITREPLEKIQGYLRGRTTR